MLKTVEKAVEVWRWERTRFSYRSSIVVRSIHLGLFAIIAYKVNAKMFNFWSKIRSNERVHERIIFMSVEKRVLWLNVRPKRGGSSLPTNLLEVNIENGIVSRRPGPLSHNVSLLRAIIETIINFIDGLGRRSVELETVRGSCCRRELQVSGSRPLRGCVVLCQAIEAVIERIYCGLCWCWRWCSRVNKCFGTFQSVGLSIDVILIIIMRK